MSMPLRDEHGAIQLPIGLRVIVAIIIGIVAVVTMLGGIDDWKVAVGVIGLLTAVGLVVG